MSRLRGFVLVVGAFFVLSFFCIAISYAQTDEIGDEIFDLTLAEILDMKVSVASKTVQKAAESPGVVYVFTRREIDQLGAKTLGDVLNLVPGFDVVRSVGINEHENIQVRGKASMYSEAVLILVDGVRQTDVIYGSSVVISRFYNLHNVERIEIIRGPGSALYGAGAFAGVVSITTRSGKDNQDYVANVEAGSFDTYSGSLYKGWKFGNFSFSTALQYNEEEGDKYRDLVAKLGRPISETRDPVEDYELNFKANYDTDVVKAEFGLKTLDREDTDFIPDGWRNEKVPGADNETKNGVDTAYGRLGVSFLDRGTLNISLSAVDNESKNYYQLFAPDELPPDHPHAISGRGVLAGPYVETLTYAGEVQGQWDFSDTHTLIAGTSYQIDDPKEHWGWGNIDLSAPPPAPVVPEYTKYNTTSDEKRKVFGIYLQDSFQVVENVTGTVGVRFDDYNDVGDTINPRLALVYTPDDATSIKLLAASAFRAPSYVELYHHNNPSSIGNEDLDPEEIQTYELYVQRTFRKKLQLAANVYHSRIDNFITTVSEAGSIAVFQNTGENINTGFEAEAKFIYDPRNTITLNYSFTDPEDDETNEDLHDIAKHALNFIVNKSLGRHLDLAVYSSYRSSRSRAPGDSRSDVDSYIVVNAKLSAKIRDNIRAYVRGSNIFDEEYYGPEAADLVPGDTPNRGAGFYVGVKATF